MSNPAEDGTPPTKEELLSMIQGKLSSLSLERLKQLNNILEGTGDDGDDFSDPGKHSPPPSSVPTPLLTPKLPVFSGDGTKDMGYTQWRYHVRCLITDPTYQHAQHLIMQAVRQSLRGMAADVVIYLGETTTPQDVLDKFDTLFGDVLTGGQITTQFFLATQGPRENVTCWGCRLHSIVTQIQRQEPEAASFVTPKLADRFWEGLYNDKMKESLRPKHEAQESFDHMLTAARQYELPKLMQRQNAAAYQQAEHIFSLPEQTSTTANQTPEDFLLQKIDQKLDKFGRELKLELKEFDTRLRAIEPANTNHDNFVSGSAKSGNQRSGANSNQKKQTSTTSKRSGCARCGYPSHTREQCVAQRDIYGNWLNPLN